tara:strand:- start:1376 stop:2137 length:762 start_codon:yes stop_codon:yes gene_type:complete
MESNKIVAITQARTGSRRFPNKVLKTINGKSLLEIHLERIMKSKSIDDIYVATTRSSKDNIIEIIAKNLGIKTYRGSENDVLARFYNCIKNVKPKYIIRLTSDCPLIDPDLIDEIINFSREKDYDYISNTLIEHFPDGQDIELFKFSALEIAYKNAKKKSEREHVTPYIIKNSSFHNKNIFKSKNYSSTINYNSIRMTVDEEDDFKTIEYLVSKLGLKKNWKEYAEFLKNNSSFVFNSNIIRNEGYLNSIKDE